MTGNYGAAREYLEEALGSNRRSVRVNILLGDFAAAENQHDEALAIWRRVETQQPAYLPLVAAKILDSFKALDRDAEGLTLLQHYLVNSASIDMLNIVYQATLELTGLEAANQLVREELRRHPTLQGFEKLLEALLFEVAAEKRQDIQIFKELIHQHSQRLAYYQCSGCGFKARQFFWRCPACVAWETFPPRRLEESAP